MRRKILILAGWFVAGSLRAGLGTATAPPSPAGTAQPPGGAACQGGVTSEQAGSTQALADSLNERSFPPSDEPYLEFFTGTWKVTATIEEWPSPPQEFAGTLVSFWLPVGGRVLSTRLRLAGDIELERLDAYDPRTREYLSIWPDDQGSPLYRGACKPPCKALVVTGTANMRPQCRVNFKAVFTVLGPDTYRYERTLQFSDGKSLKVLAYTATRLHP